jgi:D-alanyl-D-alanine carboxypeptidase/D-alanyl-D-alanine-endopeptidase (penicillin-binding protein 4)
VCGVNLNYNRIQIKTLPSYHNGGTAIAVLEPKTKFLSVVSEARTASSGRNISFSIEREKEAQNLWPLSANDGLRKGDKIIINGTTSKHADPFYSLLAINDPGIFAATILKEALEAAGVKVLGKVERKFAPKTTQVLAEHVSRSLAEALIDFTKVSNNVATDVLVKAIAAQAGIKPASFAEGLKLINEFLVKEVGITENIVAADGAGLSRYNLVTPQQMVKLLQYATNHFQMGPEFIAALPIGGEDGTMRRRLNAENTRGLVRVKTGAMSGLSSLVGYLIDEKGERYVFAIMINGFIGSAQPYISLQDKIVAAMIHDDQQQLANVK